MIVLVGESSSGKSSVEKELVNEFGYEKVLLHTTRPPRENEQEGVDYHFCGKDEFNCRQNEFEYASVSVYNDWFYGVPNLIDDDTSDRSVIVATPKVLRELNNSNVKNVYSFYIYLNRRDRLVSSLIRGDDIEETYRRSLTDKGQFDGVDYECNFIITNGLDLNNLQYYHTPRELAKKIDELYKSYKNRTYKPHHNII